MMSNVLRLQRGEMRSTTDAITQAVARIADVARAQSSATADLSASAAELAAQVRLMRETAAGVAQEAIGLGAVTEVFSSRPEPALTSAARDRPPGLSA